MDAKCIKKPMTPWAGLYGRVALEAPLGQKGRRRGGGAIDRTRATMASLVDSAECAAFAWMSRHGLSALRVGLGVVYIWFGALKIFPSLSPAEALVADTFRFFDPRWFLPTLGVGEAAIGLCLVFGVFMRVALPLLFLHMAGTVLPLFVLPSATWTRFPFAPTLEGQYIVKNIVIVGAGLVLGGATRWQKRRAHYRSQMSGIDASPPSGNGMRIR